MKLDFKQNMTLINPKTPFDLPLLPPKINYLELITDITKAHTALARLDETLKHFQNPQIIEHAFFTREAVLSSKIEGTQVTIEEVFEEEADIKKHATETTKRYQDIKEIINYRKSIRTGIDLINKAKPLAENNIKILHSILLQSVRGKTKAPGEFRKEQVHIGPEGTPMSEARYVPPSPTQVPHLYSNFDQYFNSDGEKDLLIQLAVSHYQFEAIHPFKDGNGRIGRLMIPLFLYQRKILAKPYIYVSKYFEDHRRDYYNLLADVSYKDAWIPWIRFFLNGLTEQATEATLLVGDILELQRSFHDIITDFNSIYAVKTLDVLFLNPIIQTTQLRTLAGIKSVATLLNLIKKFEKAGILVDLTPQQKRNKTYAFAKLLNILNNHRDS